MRTAFVVLTIIAAFSPFVVPTAEAEGIADLGNSLSLTNAGPIAGLATLAWAFIGLRLMKA